MRSSIDKLEKKANICINGYLSKTHEYCGKWAGATLERLPLWGKRYGKAPDNEINFEWPTEEMFSAMTPDVSLKSIEFKDYLYGLASVKVNLSNGESSPWFEY